MSNLPLSALQQGALRRATLVSAPNPDVAQVQLEDGALDGLECDVLHTSDARMRLTAGDTVLVWLPGAGKGVSFWDVSDRLPR
jgi:hypothetical protein